MPRVLNVRTATVKERQNAVYCGRPGVYGNPWKMNSERDRDWACDNFEKYTLPELDVSELRGRDLLCWCAPLRCHCDSILKKANA